MTTTATDEKDLSLEEEENIIRSFANGEMELSEASQKLSMNPEEVEETARLMLAADRRENLYFEAED